MLQFVVLGLHQQNNYSDPNGGSLFTLRPAHLPIDVAWKTQPLHVSLFGIASKLASQPAIWVTLANYRAS